MTRALYISWYQLSPGYSVGLTPTKTVCMPSYFGTLIHTIHKGCENFELKIQCMVRMRQAPFTTWSPSYVGTDEYVNENNNIQLFRVGYLYNFIIILNVVGGIIIITSFVRI